jgi:hypothetical protein
MRARFFMPFSVVAALFAHLATERGGGEAGPLALVFLRAVPRRPAGALLPLTTVAALVSTAPVPPPGAEIPRALPLGSPTGHAIRRPGHTNRRPRISGAVPGDG